MAGKKKKQEDSEDEDPYDDEFFERLNEQMKEFMGVLPFKLPAKMDFRSDYFKNMFKNIMKQLNIDPSMLGNMSAEEVQDILKNAKINIKGPFMFGFNMGIDPEGNIKWEPVSNIKQDPQPEVEVKTEKDPLVDIYEEDDDLVVVCEVPGVDKRNIELKASINELEIIANSEDQSDSGNKFNKIINLPADIDPDHAKARYNNGILEVRLRIIEKNDKRKRIEFEDD